MCDWVRHFESAELWGAPKLNDNNEDFYFLPHKGVLRTKFARFMACFKSVRAHQENAFSSKYL